MVASQDARPKWGDMQNDEEVAGLPARWESEVGADNIKTVVEYKHNENGDVVKVTSTVKVTKVVKKMNKRVVERQGWAKFGQYTQKEVGMTSRSEELFLELTKNKNKPQQSEAEAPQATKSIVLCRVCGQVGDHWTLKCPYKDRMETQQKIDALGAGGSSRGPPGRDGPPLSGLDALAAGGPSKYVPPSLRGKGTDERMRAREDMPTVRVTNLSEDVREQDLQDLFRPFGGISRIFLAKDKMTGLSKGFAFITFHHREDASRAIEKLNGFGYDNLILSCEWARPSNRD
eukprot:GFYU01005895.1.p1 GENE.GFYU01005895.1~~GFYU01005895.1.p1  ORF type:complete len:288 (-),score=77.92 GFYU01005895.1:451-1314(-)